MADKTEIPTGDASVLFITDRPLSIRDRRQLIATVAGRTILLLDLSPAEDVAVDGLSITRLRIDELLDLPTFHGELVQFLDRWPKETVVKGRPFSDVFRQTTGDSLWWTGPGSLRHPFSGPIVPFLKAIWILREAVEQNAVGEILWSVGDRRLASVLSAFGQAASVPCSGLPTAAKPWSAPSFAGRTVWLLKTAIALKTLLVWILVRAVYARALTRPSVSHSQSKPAIVMSGWYPNHVRDDDEGRPFVAYWKPLADVLSEKFPQVGIRYLLHTTTFRLTGMQRWLRPFYNGWSRLPHVEGLLPLTQSHPQLGAYLLGVVHQWKAMWTYTRWEAAGTFEQSPGFAGVDVSLLLIPPLRQAVAAMAKWSRNVAATAESLRQAGNVKAVLVHEEFYPKGMLTIAAARMLGIPTIGVQHGLIGPQHTVYMPPEGHVLSAPSPDWFAAYGEATAEVLCEAGAYPRSRVCITGAPRFDVLAASPPARNEARDELAWSHDQPVILLTTESFPLSSPILRGLLPLADAHPDWRFVAKLHPHDRDPERYDALLAESGLANVELVRDRLPERMAACDVLITGYSTTAIEALLMGKPVICADFSTSPDRYPFVKDGAAAGARDVDQLHSAVVAALRDGMQTDRCEEFLRHHLGPTVDGRAADAFAKWIIESDFRVC